MQDLPSELSAGGGTGLDDWTAGLEQWAEGRITRDSSSPLLDEAMPAFERTLIRIALRRARGKRLEAARLLGWGRNTLTRKIKEYGIEGPY